MTGPADEILNFDVGGKTVAENLRHAIKSGRLLERDDGSLEIAADPKGNVAWMYVSSGPPLGCGFLMNFMFKQAYGEAAVPQGCSACYKIKLVFATLRQLVAGWELGKQLPYRSKWGTDLNNPYSQNVYAGYFYLSGLDAARTLFKSVREMVDHDPNLGPDIGMNIKRGCSEYEAALGPSDRYQFKKGMAEVEASLKSRFRPSKTPHHPSLVVANWIETAFNMGDNTYLDYTGGMALREKTLVYPP